jgi:hypothetical protein
MAIVLCVTVACTQPAHAYVDPGTGSMLVQMAMAGIAGALFYFRELRMQLAGWIRRSVLRRYHSATATTDKDDMQSQRLDI